MMRMRADDKFEIQVMRDGRWLVADIADDERAAEKEAKRRFGDATLEAVRVVRDRATKDGLHAEKVVLELTRSVTAQKPLTIMPIETAPVCESVSDFYRVTGRFTISRLYRKYLDRYSVTPFEVLHNHAHLKRAMKHDELLYRGIDRAASVQSRKASQDTKARRDFIEHAFKDIVGRAKEIDDKGLPKVRDSGFAGALKAVAEGVEAGEIEYRRRVLLAKELGNAGGFWTKLAMVVGWVGTQPETELMGLIDEVVADLVAVPEVLQDVLGFRRNLSLAITAKVDLLEGRLEPAAAVPGTQPDDETKTIVAALNSLMQAGALPGTAHVVVERIRGALESSAPLTGDEAEQETAALVGLVTRMQMPEGGLYGGSTAALALINRGGRIVNAGGNAGFERGLQLIINKLERTDAAIRFLAAAADSSLPDDRINMLERRLEPLIMDAKSVIQVVGKHRSPIMVMRKVTGLYTLIEQSAMNSTAKTYFLGHLDKLLMQFFDEGRILEVLNNPSMSLRDRAYRMLDLCADGVLPPGKARDMARNLVLGHLRRPTFTEDFVADIGQPAEKEATLRRFYATLRQYGFA